MGYLEFGLLLIVVTVCAGEICKPDEIKLDGKEMCICSSDGSYWDCAVRDNPGSSSWSPRNRRSATNKDHCEPGTSFKKNCNTCVCGDNGLKSKAACTRILCHVANWYKNGTPKKSNASTVTPKKMVDDDEERCEPGTVFKKYCNTCKCGINGLVSKSACTRVLCDAATVNKDGTPKQDHDYYAYQFIDKHLAAERCIPGREFKKYCNTCLCGEDGLAERANCTKEFCDRGLWASDGTPRAEVEFVPMAL